MKLIVIDMQKEIVVDELYNFRNFKNNVIKLVSTARSNNIEVIFIKHDAGANSNMSEGDIGFEIIDEIKPQNTEKTFVKTINSCFGNIEFNNYLEKENDKELMIIGLQTDFCIDATIKSAFEKGYNIIVPKDANSTFDNDILKGLTICRFYNEWVWPGTFSEVVNMKEAIKLLNKD